MGPSVFLASVPLEEKFPSCCQGATHFAFAGSVCPFELKLGSEGLDLSWHQSVKRFHQTGPEEKRVSNLEGDSSLGPVPVEGRFAVEILVDRVPAERIPVEIVASCHPVHVDHWKDSVCHLRVDPPQPLDEC